MCFIIEILCLHIAKNIGVNLPNIKLPRKLHMTKIQVMMTWNRVALLGCNAIVLAHAKSTHDCITFANTFFQPPLMIQKLWSYNHLEQHNFFLNNSIIMIYNLFSFYINLPKHLFSIIFLFHLFIYSLIHSIVVIFK